MTEELVDIVDDKDQPTGDKTTSQQAHEQSLIHRISAVHVFRPDGKLIIQVHKRHGRKFDHSVGGHVDTGEDYLKAAQREMREELGLDTELESIAHSILSVENYSEWGLKNRHMFGVFKTTTPTAWQFIPNDEVDQIHEMELSEIVNLMNQEPEKFLKGFLVSLDTYLKAINSPLIIEGEGKNWGKL